MRHQNVHLVPLLSAGAHAHPRHGGCLLELASTLPGGPWADRPPGDRPEPVTSSRRMSALVHSELRAPDGAESLYHHASAVIDAWPPWLLDTCSDAHPGPGSVVPPTQDQRTAAMPPSAGPSVAIL